jgi:hypothetical protein
MPETYADLATTLGYDWSDREVRQDIRRWGRENGYEVGLTGVLPRLVLDAHHASKAKRAR